MSIDSCDLQKLLEEIRKHIVVDRDRIPHFDKDGLELLEKFKLCFIKQILGSEVDLAYEWLDHVKRSLDIVSRRLGIAGFTFAKEFSSFMESPIDHLKKKLFNYIYDLVREKISLEEFIRRAGAAIRTSLKTNLRSCYQIWALTSIMALMIDRGYDLAYPEHRFLNFDRSGKQKLGVIPPNFVLLNIRKGYLSFFHEAPRPLGWEDTSDLQKIWSLYTALRPDAMVYSGKVLNIVDLGSSPPIKRPNVILEFKELEDWYTRVRDLKGYFRKPLTAEEWRSKWLEGLFDGLADIMGVKRTEVRKKIEEGVSLRVREYQLVQLYRSTYKPDTMILVSRKTVPSDIRRHLEDSGIQVVDGVEFDVKKLEPVVDILEKYVSFGSEESISISIPKDLVSLIDEAGRRLGVHDPVTIIRIALEELVKKMTQT